MKVWIVFKGTYSDRGIEAVFDNKEAADAFYENNWGRDRYPEMDIEEWEVGAECKRLDRQVWEVYMDKGGNVVAGSFGYGSSDPKRLADSAEEMGPWLTDRLRNGEPGVLWVAKVARSAEHIVKIANEIRTQWIATGEWERKEAERKAEFEKRGY